MALLSFAVALLVVGGGTRPCQAGGKFQGVSHCFRVDVANGRAWSVGERHMPPLAKAVRCGETFSAGGAALELECQLAAPVRISVVRLRGFDRDAAEIPRGRRCPPTRGGVTAAESPSLPRGRLPGRRLRRSESSPQFRRR